MTTTHAEHTNPFASPSTAPVSPFAHPHRTRRDDDDYAEDVAAALADSHAGLPDVCASARSHPGKLSARAVPLISARSSAAAMHSARSGGTALSSSRSARSSGGSASLSARARDGASGGGAAFLRESPEARERERARAAHVCRVPPMLVSAVASPSPTQCVAPLALPPTSCSGFIDGGGGGGGGGAAGDMVDDASVLLDTPLRAAVLRAAQRIEAQDAQAEAAGAPALLA
jgi:hypothetical protein